MCNCPKGTKVQEYQNTVELKAPEWSSKKYIVIDKCIAPEIQALWDHNVRTSGSCCGHHIYEPYINPMRFTDACTMVNMGYIVQLNKFGALCARPKTIFSNADWKV